MIQYSDEIIEELKDALIRDPQFQFKKEREMLRYGICPNCGKRECFVDLQKPFLVSCGRLNKCRWSASTYELYPDIFRNLSRRHPPTRDNPQATADAYMSQVRGFELAKIRGMYFQANAKHEEKEEYYPAVKVIVNQSCYWICLINAADVVKNDGKSKKIIGPYKGEAWAPPEMEFKANDEIWITEAIFKSMALLSIGVKSIAALSAGNFPANVIERHKGKKITWIVATDNDEAGRTAAKKFKKEIEAMGENALTALTEHENEDWDDALKKGKLSQVYLNDSFWRGFYHMAESALDKAFFLYCRTHRKYYLFEAGIRLYRYKVDESVFEDENRFVYPDPEKGWLLPKNKIAVCLAKFASGCEIKEIAPSNISLIYQEENILTREITDTFYIEPANGAPPLLMTEFGNVFKKPESFNEALLKRTGGNALFRGSPTDLEILHERWFNPRPPLVKTAPFIGYEPETKAYIFPDFAYFRGERSDVNDYGYARCGRTNLRCSIVGTKIQSSCDEFNPDWIIPYTEAFHLNGLVLLSWWVGTFFADQIREKTASWPFLEYTGDPGSGKSTQIRFLWRATGIDQHEGFDPNNSTIAGRAAEMTKYHNLPVVLLEGDRIGKDAKRNNKAFDFTELRPYFDHGAPSRVRGMPANCSRDTEKLIFHGGILITQNATVHSEPAILSRIVHCHCTQDFFTPANAHDAEKLKGMDTRKLGGFLHQCLKNEIPLLSGFFKDFALMTDEFNRRNDQRQIKEIRIRECHAKIAAWTMQLPKIFPSLSDDWVQQTIDYLWSRALDRQTRLQSDQPELEQFWDIYEYLHEQRVGGVTEEILNHSADPKVIAINLPHFIEVASGHRQMLNNTSELSALLKHSSKHKFIAFKTVRSCLFKKVIGCYCFEKGKEQNRE